MTGPSTDRVTVGRIVKPHGIRGEVVVELLTDRPDRFAAGAVVHGEQGTAYTVASSRPHKGRLLVAFEDVGDRSAAETFRGMELTADADEADRDETFLASELVGMEVVHHDGRSLGRVSALMDLPATADYDLLEVTRDDGSEWLLPAVGDYVAVDVDERGRDRLVVTEEAPAGLVDEEAADVVAAVEAVPTSDDRTATSETDDGEPRPT